MGEDARLQTGSKALVAGTKEGGQRTTKPLTPPAAPSKHGLYVKAKPGLVLRYRRVRRLVRKMQKVMPWLDPSDMPAARAWAELEILCALAFAALVTGGLTNDKGDPRRLLSEYRQMRQAQLPYDRDLGMTPAARMALRVGDSRARALDRDGDHSPALEDVVALEQRLLARAGVTQGCDMADSAPAREGAVRDTGEEADRAENQP